MEDKQSKLVLARLITDRTESLILTEKQRDKDDQTRSDKDLHVSRIRKSSHDVERDERRGERQALQASCLEAYERK